MKGNIYTMNDSKIVSIFREDYHIDDNGTILVDNLDYKYYDNNYRTVRSLNIDGTGNKFLVYYNADEYSNICKRLRINKLLCKYPLDSYCDHYPDYRPEVITTSRYERLQCDNHKFIIEDDIEYCYVKDDVTNHVSKYPVDISGKVDYSDLRADYKVLSKYGIELIVANDYFLERTCTIAGYKKNTITYSNFTEPNTNIPIIYLYCNPKTIEVSDGATYELYYDEYGILISSSDSTHTKYKSTKLGDHTEYITSKHRLFYEPFDTDIVVDFYKYAYPLYYVEENLHITADNHYSYTRTISKER